jgi:hypothetical protein
MKINPRLYPTIIVVVFVLFLLAAVLAGLRPLHGQYSSLIPISSISSLLPL